MNVYLKEYLKMYLKTNGKYNLSFIIRLGLTRTIAKKQKLILCAT